jgi:hypothetical protein
MKSKIFALMVVVTVVLGVGGLGTTQVAKANTISILALDTSGDNPYPDFDTPILGALTGTTYTEVSPSDFASAELSAYDVLYVGSAFQTNSVVHPSQAALDALNSRTDDIAAFVESGGGIVAFSEPIGTGRYTWLPNPVVPSSRSDRNYISIVDGSHPVMSGLTDAGLSGWYVGSHNYFTDVGSYSVLANASGMPVTLAGSYGCGRIVLSGQDTDFHFFINPYAGKQYKEFLQNAIDWVVPSPPCVEIVEIDIKPGSYPNSINLGSHGAIPVAILTTEDFDATTVDPGTVQLEGLGVEVRGKSDKLLASEEDVDGDGDIDLVVKIDSENLEPGALQDGAVVLTGETYGGQAIEGIDYIIIVPPEE